MVIQSRKSPASLTYIALILVLVLFGNRAFAADPAIDSVDPSTAAPGDTVTISGTSLTASVRLFESATQKVTNVTGTLQTGGDAGDTVEFKVPNITPGDYQVSIVAGDYHSNTLSFTINSSSDSSSSSDTSGTSGGPTFTKTTAPKVSPVPGYPNNLGEFVVAIFTWSLRLVGLAVFIQFLRAGIIYFTAAGNTTKTGEATDMMKNAALGALLLFASYIILYTINPNLVSGTLNLPGSSTTTSNNSGGGSSGGGNGGGENGGTSGQCASEGSNWTLDQWKGYFDSIKSQYPNVTQEAMQATKAGLNAKGADWQYSSSNDPNANCGTGGNLRPRIYFPTATTGPLCSPPDYSYYVNVGNCFEPWTW